MTQANSTTKAALLKAYDGEQATRQTQQFFNKPAFQPTDQYWRECEINKRLQQMEEEKQRAEKERQAEIREGRVEAAKGLAWIAGACVVMWICIGVIPERYQQYLDTLPEHCSVEMC